MAGIDSNTKLCMHYDGTDGSTTMKDSSPRHHVFTAYGDAQLDIAQKKWGTSSLMLDGSDYIDTPNSDDWDIFEDDSSYWTLDFQVKMNNQTGTQTFCSHADNSATGYYWYFQHDSVNGFELILVNSGVNFTITGGSISDTNWHHVCLIKKALDYGIYLDGTQVAFLRTTVNGHFNMRFAIGAKKFGYVSSVTNYLDGWIDEFRVQRSNYFGGAPNIGLTNLITPPTAAYTGYDPGAANAVFFGANQ